MADEPPKREGMLDEIRRLEVVAEQLEDAIDDLEHECRRAQDALIRAGGRSPSVESRLQTLQESCDKTRRDMKENGDRRRELRARLPAMEAPPGKSPAD